MVLTRVKLECAVDLVKYIADKIIYQIENIIKKFAEKLY